MVYHGAGQGISVYHDGSKIGTDRDKASKSTVAGSGRVDRINGSTYVDEIKMYNRQLSESEIQNMYWYKIDQCKQLVFFKMKRFLWI